MKQTTLRSLSIILILVFLLSILPPVAFAAQRNTGTRHELCTSLSSQAVAYYTGDYSPDALVAYETDTTGSCLAAVDSELYNALQSLMTKTMTKSISYSSLTSYWPDTDCSNNSNNAVLFYSDQVSSSYNREHVWPKSRASFLKQDGGCDLHHLRPTNSSVNSARSNYTFANVREMFPDPSDYPYNGRTVLWYNASYTENSPEEQGNDNLGLVEINDNIKGDTARILLYVYTRWEEKNLFENDPNAKPGPSDDENNGLRVIYDLETLLQWCEMDPVDTWEMSRNDASQAVQGNRNVFIDYPELAWLLFGETPPADMEVPEKLPLGTTAYTITASSNNTAWGTVTQNGRRITANPKEGYYAEDYTILSGNAKVRRDGDVFIVTPESDCTIQINFAPKTVVTATFNGGVESISTYAGEAIVLPTATAHEGYRFMGWVTENVDDTPEKPTWYEAGSTYILSDNVSFLALYAYSDGEGFGEWVLVTDDSTLRPGIQLVIASTENKVVAAPLNGKYLTKASATFSADGSTIEAMPEDAVILILGGEEDAWTLAGEDGKLLGVVGQKNIGWDAGSNKWKITISNTNATMYSANESYGRILYNASSPRFTTYTNATSSTLVLPQLYTNDGGVIYYTTNPLKCEHSYETVITVPTCTEGGYTTYTCSKCGYSYKDEPVNALGHCYEAVVTAPTCTAAGFTTYTCSVCGDSYEADTTVALGHNYVPEHTSTTDSCTEDTLIRYCCARCMDMYTETIPATGHAWDEGTVTLAPTEEAEGERTYTCINCGETKTESIPMIEPEGCEYGKSCGSLIFTDMPELGNWAHAGIDFVVEKGLFNGMSKDIFAPDKTMTRAMLVTVLWRRAGEKEADGMAFTDVPQGLWYSKAIAWAAVQGVVTGYPDGTFRPDNEITREQLATILFRFAKLYEMDPPERADLDSFPDSKDVQSYAVEAFRWAVGKGLVNGIYDSSAGETFLRPAGSATRAQVATILMRFMAPEA